MKFVMVGSGAIGSYFGAKLQQAGHEVVFVARGEMLRALCETGITIRHEDEEFRIPSVTATDDITTIGSADYVLIAVKAWQVEDLAQKLPSLKGDRTRFLTLQNGVEAAHIVAKYVGEEHTLGGLVRGFFQLEAPGKARHIGVQPAIIFGQMDGSRTPEAEQLLHCLTTAGIYAELSDDIEAALWGKFLLVTSLSGVGALTRSTIGEIREFEPTRQMLQAVMVEIVNVARGRGIKLPDDIVERTLEFVGTFPHEAKTSMQRDVMNGLPSELEAQTGAVVRLGREASVATPINQYIYDSLILQEMRARALQ
jgi:2-dehydropantoate 2-reductase